MNKKFVAVLEMSLMMFSFFAFGYFAGYGELSVVLALENDGDKDFRDWLDELDSFELIEESSWESYPISTGATDIGCCFLNVDSEVCGTTSPENCVDDSPFAEGEICASTTFCGKGCCYDDDAGIYDKNVLQVNCPTSWVSDPNCNLNSRSNLGCCILGSETNFGTEGQCEVDSLVRGIGDDVVDWNQGVGEVECLMLAGEQEEGACVFEGGSCKFESEVECLSSEGDFYVDTLCTSESLDTNCEMTEQTRCVDGEDEVFFVDSCGNTGNVYDSSRVEDESYWDVVVAETDLCGAGEGNVESEDCGNCNRFLGGACGVAGEGEVDFGGFFCEDVGCEFEGESFGNGESWCIYDGAIGDGDDVVGSRHWKATCSQGKTQIEPCADYRNQICIQSNEFELEEENVEFKNAACVANNWRACVALNEDEDAIEECGNTLNCRVDTVEISPEFTFDVCLPKYPAGFSLNNERSQATGESLCGMADTTCTVVQKSKFWGGCEYVANEECLSETFGEEMNDFCRGLGDCGGSVNVLGEFSDSYKILESEDLNSAYISALKRLALPVPGEFAEAEDYSEFLGEVNVVGEVDADGNEVVNPLSGVATGLSGIGYAAGVLVTGSSSLVGLGAASKVAVLKGGSSFGSFSTSAAGFAGIAIGAGIGMIVGGMIAKSLGLSEGGSMLMSIGGGLVGGALAYNYLAYGLISLGPVGWIGLAIMVIAAFFLGDDCDPIEVQFECEMWQPPVGGSDCEECNSGGALNPDGTKPCSPYRCESLGASCELLNVGTGNEICVHGNPNDVTPPAITHPVSGVSDAVKYETTSDGVKITDVEGGCLTANTHLTFGVITNEPARCRLDSDPAVDFDDMIFDFGRDSYLYNHTTSFLLPDPSAGQSQGLNWTNDLEMYVKCSDRNGLVSVGAYEVSMCVAEGEDVLGPVITDSSEGDLLVGIDDESEYVEIFTNELSNCRWDFLDMNYSLMSNDMECDDLFGRPSSPNGYVCSDTVPVKNETTTYYVRCIDQPWLNASDSNEGSYSFVIRKPETKISVDGIKPDSDYEVSTDLVTVGLKIATSGGASEHYCSYSFSGYEKMFSILETGADRLHLVDLNMAPGKQKVYVECRDETGDFDRGLTEFEIVRDSSSPAIARIWQNGGNIKFVTIENSECKYSLESCRFAWSEGDSAGSGLDHSIGAKQGETYHIKCADSFGNMPNGCSVEVTAV